jgi:hypothetical protein
MRDIFILLATLPVLFFGDFGHAAKPGMICENGVCRPAPTRKQVLQVPRQRTADCLCDPCLCPRCECGPVVQAKPTVKQSLTVQPVVTYAVVTTKSYRAAPVRRVFRGGLLRRWFGGRR